MEKLTEKEGKAVETIISFVRERININLNNIIDSINEALEGGYYGEDNEKQDHLTDIMWDEIDDAINVPVDLMKILAMCDDKTQKEICNAIADLYYPEFRNIFEKEKNEV